MKNILDVQKSLQARYSTMRGYPLLNPSEFDHYSVGEVYDFIRHMKFCLNEELTELMEAMGNNSRDIHKPWSKDYFKIRAAPSISTPHMREEAIDALCFLMNVMLAVGITPSNLEVEYFKVLDKNMKRIEAYEEAQRKRGGRTVGS